MEISRGITNIWQISQNKNVSNAVPLKIRFFLPPTAYGLTHLPLSYSVQDFETYSAVTASGARHEHEVTIWNLNASLDSYQLVAQVRAGSLTFSIPTDYPPGTDLTLGNANDELHSHPISANLGTSAADCNDIQISVDGVDKTAVIETALGRSLETTDDSDIELFSYLSTPVLNTWHEVIITPNGSGSPAGMCYMYAFISPESVIKKV